MSVEVSEDMIGIADASAELDRLMAADAAAAKPSDQPAGQPDQSANQGQRAAQTETSTAQTPDKLSTDTQATAEPPKQQPQQKTDKDKPSPEASEAGKTLSRYAKARDRQEKSWAQLNQEKEALKAQREAFERERQEFAAQREKQEQKYSPEQYENAAKVFEKEGKFDLAEAAKARAKQLRENPPSQAQGQAAAQQVQRQQAEQFEAQKKEWWGKAAMAYPSVVQQGSPENQALSQFIQSEPDVMRSPKGMFYAARLVSAETAAARVPAMEKELGALRAKVKELEALTSPSVGETAGKLPGERSFDQLSDAEQLAQLERLAMETGALR